MDPKIPTFVFILLFILGNSEALKYEFEILAVNSLGANVTLECNNTSEQSRSAPANYTPVSWMLPDLSVLRSTEVNSEKYEILNENWTLKIAHVTKGDFGYYHCMLQNANNSLHLIRVGLNVAGPFFTDQWDLYRSNFFQGLGAFLGFIIASLLVVATHKYRWRESGRDETWKPSPPNIPDDSAVGLNHFQGDDPGKVMVEGYGSRRCRVQLEDCSQSSLTDHRDGREGGIAWENGGFVSESQF